MGREVTQERRGEWVAWGAKGTHSWGPRATHSWVTETTHEWGASVTHEWGTNIPFTLGALFVIVAKRVSLG